MILQEQSFTDQLLHTPDLLPTLTLVFAAILGLLVGSFSNVLIYRMPRYCMSIVSPPSHCPKCETPIQWYDNLPVISWALLLRGRCRKCKVKIPIRYPLVEIIVGVVFLLLAREVLVRPWEAHERLTVGGDYFLFLFWATGAVMLFVGAWIDAQMQIIPDRISLGGAAFALLAAPFVPQLHQWAVPTRLVSDALFFASVEPMWLRAWLTSAALMGIAAAGLWAFGLLGYLVAPAAAKEAGGGMGMGDVKIIAFMAGLLGWPKLLVAFGVAIGLGAIVGFPKLYRKWLGKPVDSMIAFGPFLCIGAIVAILFARPIFDWVIQYLEVTRLISPVRN
ncbi:MAG: prepilin peptidase [Planctomycetes bacterium]|nr:prepilin peptidase [Planctomycetota bacterium]